MKAIRIMNFFLVTIMLLSLVVTPVFAGKPGSASKITVSVDGETVLDGPPFYNTKPAEAFSLNGEVTFTYTESTRKGVTSLSLKADFSGVTGGTNNEYVVIRGSFSWSGVTGGTYQGNFVMKDTTTGARFRVQFRITVTPPSSNLTIDFIDFWKQ